MSHGVDPWLFFVPVFRAQWLPARRLPERSQCISLRTDRFIKKAASGRSPMVHLLSEESVCILPCFACAVSGGRDSCDFAEGFGEVAA